MWNSISWKKKHKHNGKRANWIINWNLLRLPNFIVNVVVKSNFFAMDAYLLILFVFLMSIRGEYQKLFQSAFRKVSNSRARRNAATCILIMFFIIILQTKNSLSKANIEKPLIIISSSTRLKIFSARQT